MNRRIKKDGVALALKGKYVLRGYLTQLGSVPLLDRQKQSRVGNQGRSSYK